MVGATCSWVLLAGRSCGRRAGQRVGAARKARLSSEHNRLCGWGVGVMGAGPVGHPCAMEAALSAPTRVEALSSSPLTSSNRFDDTDLYGMPLASSKALCDGML